MHVKQINYQRLFLCLAIAACCLFSYTSVCQAAYWTALPPYNTLWPLWSPVLSPEDPVTGLPTPLVDSLTASTVLPVQPALTWDPDYEYPFLLYPTPFGLAYYEPLYGLNFWPPDYLIDPDTGTPLPLVLKGGSWQNLPPIPIEWAEQFVPVANIIYYLQYDPFYAFEPEGFNVLLTPAAIWGL